VTVRRLLRLLSAVCVAAAATVLFAGGGVARRAVAVDAIQAGSWWRAQPSSGGAPAPPQVQQGGLWVAIDPSGPSAVSALRFTLAEGESAPLVTLRVNQATMPAGASITACATTADWKPATAGPWDAQPKPDCSSGVVAGTFSTDGTMVGFDLSPLVTGSEVNAVFTPNPPPSPAGTVSPPVPIPGAPPVNSTPTAFDITFKPPATSDVNPRTEPVSDSGGGTDLGPTATDFSAPVQEALPSSLPTDVSPSASTPSASSSAPASQPTAQAATPLPRAVRSALHRRDIRNRFIAGIAFLDLAGLWWWLSYRSPAAARVDEGRPFLRLGEDPNLVPRPSLPRPRGATQVPALR